MARARFLRPEFFTDEKIGELCFGARLLYAGTWLHADLNGVLEWRPKQLRALMFPYDEGVTSKQVAEWMESIVSMGFVDVFTVGAATYGIIRNFQKHQTFTKSERKAGSRHPTPPGFVSRPRQMPGHGREDEGEEDGSTQVPIGGTRVPPDDDSEAPRNAKPAPAPSPTPAPAPSPSPSPAREDSPATATAAQPRTLGGVKAGDVRKAIDNRDTRALLRMFRCERVDDPAWEREAVGMDHVELAALLTYRAQARDPVRMPSGLGRARRRFWVPELRSEWIAWLNGMMAKYQTAKESA